MVEKPRPVVLLNRDVVIDRLTSLIVAPCTSRIRGLPTEVALGPSDGLANACVMSLDNLTLVDRELVGSLISRLSPEKMAQACAALAIAVGCDS